MKAVPKYNVVYKGVLRRGGVPFELDEADVKEMREHCAIEAKAKQAETAEVTETEAKPKTRTRRKAEQS